MTSTEIEGISLETYIQFDIVNSAPIEFNVFKRTHILYVFVFFYFHSINFFLLIISQKYQFEMLEIRSSSPTVLKTWKCVILSILTISSYIQQAQSLWVSCILTESQCLMENKSIQFSYAYLKGSSIPIFKCITSLNIKQMNGLDP